MSKQKGRLGWGIQSAFALWWVVLHGKWEMSRGIWKKYAERTSPGRGRCPCPGNWALEGGRKIFVDFYGIDRVGGGRYNRFIWRAFHLICGRSAEKSRKYKIVYCRTKEKNGRNCSMMQSKSWYKMCFGLYYWYRIQISCGLVVRNCLGFGRAAWQLYWPQKGRGMYIMPCRSGVCSMMQWIIQGR